jgi:serine/threonine-protein kinase/endoribonuclease IRE1
LTLPELVHSSPSKADDGSIVVGTRVSSVFLLDKESGKLVRLLSGVSGVLEDTDIAGGWVGG